jgi:adenosylhomocysteine nucleosidase
MSPADPPVLVLTAIREELSPLLRRVARFSSDRIGGQPVYCTRWRDPCLIMAATGDGTPRAESRARQLADHFRPTGLLGIGMAGALSPSLSPLDLVASARVRNGSDALPPPDSLLLTIACSAGALPGTLLTVSAPLASASQKRALAESAMAPGEIAAVDMDSAGWARGAASAGVPFVVVRAISDAIDDELPEYLPRCVGPEGGIRRTAVLARAVARPATIPNLVRLRRRAAACGEKLADFVFDFFYR